MMTESQLRQLLLCSETQWIERKTSYNPNQIKAAIVGFANSLPDGQDAVLFIGVGPTGEASRVENIDKRQRDVRIIAQQQCFPAISCNPTVVRHNGIEILAVVVSASKNKPHFTGHAFVRVGSETCKASSELFEDLIASRNSKVGRLLRDKGQVVTVLRYGYLTMRIGSILTGGRETTEAHVDSLECRIENCDAFVLHYVETINSKRYVAQVDEVEIDYDVKNARTRLIVNRKRG